jgi:hypothetical protein
LHNAGTYRELRVALILFKGKWIHGSYESNIGLDVSTNPTINGDAEKKDVVFTGHWKMCKMNDIIVVLLDIILTTDGW